MGGGGLGGLLLGGFLASFWWEVLVPAFGHVDVGIILVERGRREERRGMEFWGEELCG